MAQGSAEKMSNPFWNKHLLSKHLRKLQPSLTYNSHDTGCMEQHISENNLTRN